jgi:hypothetical protein
MASALSFYSDKQNDLHGLLGSTKFKCPRGQAKASKLTFGQGYTGVSDKKTVPVVINHEDSDEIIKRPCIERYLGEPTFSYLKRRLYIAYLEFESENFKIKSNDLFAHWYRFKKSKIWGYKPEGSVVEPVVYVFHQSSHSDRAREVVHSLLLDTDIYQTNLSSDNVVLKPIDKSCEAAKNNIQKSLAEVKNSKSKICQKINLAQIVKDCFKVLKGQTDNFSEALLSACYTGTEKEYASMLVKDKDLKLNCGDYRIQRSVQSICLTSEILQSGKFEAMVYISEKLLSYSSVKVFGKVELLRSNTLLDQFDSLFDSSDDLFFLKKKELLKTTRTLQARSLKRLGK